MTNYEKKYFKYKKKYVNNLIGGTLFNPINYECKICNKSLFGNYCLLPKCNHAIHENCLIESGIFTCNKCKKSYFFITGFES